LRRMIPSSKCISLAVALPLPAHSRYLEWLESSADDVGGESQRAQLRSNSWAIGRDRFVGIERLR